MDLDAPSYRVVETVAQKEGISPIKLSPPLVNVVDPDALDALVQANAESDTSEVEIEFTYLDYVIQIRSHPTVSISVQDGDAPIDDLEPVSE